mmetsp:Transcript_16457/g.42654  ORF Transcript_16457/g.42654 Transcript_16457/m.42654 type:complete len:332 (+) Transcript_16457:421-1416(+)
MRRVAGDRDRPVGPRAQPARRVAQQRRAVVQVTPLHLRLRRRVDEFECEAVPDIAIRITRGLVGELAPQPVELGRRALWGRVLILAARRRADEGEPLLPVAACIRGHEVLVLAEQDLVRDLLDVGCSVLAQRRVAREPGEAPPRFRRDRDRVARNLPLLGIVDCTASRARRGKAAGALVEPKHLLAHGRPDPVGTHEDVRIRDRPVLERGLDASPFAEHFVLGDAAADAHRARWEAVLDKDLLDHRPVHHDRWREASLQGGPNCVEADEPVALVVLARERVASVVPDLEPGDAVGRDRALLDELVVHIRVDALQCAEGVGLDLDGSAVRRV